MDVFLVFGIIPDKRGPVEKSPNVRYRDPANAGKDIGSESLAVF